MTNRSVLYELRVDLNTKEWGIACPLDQSLIGPVQYGWDRYKKDPNSMTLGGGLLAGSPLAGTRRMVVCGYSPQWEGFYISALGGAMHVMHRTGVNYICLQGRLSKVSVMIFSYLDGVYSVRFEPINPGKYWKGYIDSDNIEWEGYYGLNHFLFEKFQTSFPDDYWRILTVGPGAKKTNFGAIGSAQVKGGKLSEIDDWAGRGGMGSRLLQYHRVAAIIIGGDWQDPALKEAKELDRYFLDHFGQTALKVDLALSEKYRYVPKFNTGGTFGVNMFEAEDKLFSFNYQSIYEPPEKRLEQHKTLISDHYLRQFNEEIINPKRFTHCGEPCAIACKKYLLKYKKDYEPYQALGPNIGIFDQRAAEKVNYAVDAEGLDAIHTGGTISWLMECFHRGILNPVDFGFEDFAPAFSFIFNANNFDIVKDSAHNAEIALGILQMILYTPQGKPFRKGIRYASAWLDRKYKVKTRDLAVYNAHGKCGCMVPNQYWTPGMFAPMPIMGKYFSYYGNDFTPPYQLGRKNIERFIYELYSENSGSCRFHRKWVDDIIDEITLSHFDLELDFWRTNYQVVKEIVNHQSRSAVFWETERVVDIIHQFLLRWKEKGLQHQELETWLESFAQDKRGAAKAFWTAMFEGMVDAVGTYFEEPIHTNHQK